MTGAPRPVRPAGTWRVGSLAGAEVWVSSSWLVIAALVAVAVAPQVEQVQPGLGPLRYVVGVVVAVVLYLAILLHELSHVLVVQRFGHHVPSISLGFMGGQTTVEGEAASPREEFLAAVVGPITSLLIGGLALALWTVTPSGVAEVVVGALAATNLGLGALNLVPVLPLDGGRVLKAAVWASTGSAVRGITVAAWAGRVAAGALVAYAVLVGPATGHPLAVVDLVIVGVMALFLWAASSNELTGARLRRRFDGVVARDLARRTLAVPPDLPVAEAVRRAALEEAGAIVTVDSTGAPLGLVHEATLRGLTDDRRPWVPTSTIARTLTPALCLSWQISGPDLLQAISRTPASEYLLVDHDGGIFGVLSLSDVDRLVGLT